MTDTPFLLAVIAHGKPVFEIGYKSECAICQGLGEFYDGCHECLGSGFWWITNTGWRAHPYWSQELEPMLADLGHDYPPDPPDDWPDLFQSYIDRSPRSAEPSSLLAQLGLAKPKAPIQRRALK